MSSSQQTSRVRPPLVTWTADTGAASRIGDETVIWPNANDASVIYPDAYEDEKTVIYPDDYEEEKKKWKSKGER